MIQLFCSASTETFWSAEGAALLVDLALELLPLNFRGRPMVRWKAKRKNYKASYSTKSAGASSLGPYHGMLAPPQPTAYGHFERLAYRLRR